MRIQLAKSNASAVELLGGKDGGPLHSAECSTHEEVQVKASVPVSCS